MSPVLAHVTDLESRAMYELTLDGQVVLLRDGWLNLSVPGEQGRPLIRKAWRRTCARSRLRRERRSRNDIGGFRLWRREGRVLRQTQVGARAFQVRRHRKGASDPRLGAERSPCEPYPRLKVRQPVGCLIETAAKAVRPHSNHRRIPRKFQGTGQRIHVHLAVVFFPPGGSRFITKP